VKARIFAAEGGVLAILGMAFIVSGRLLGAALLLALSLLAAACAWTVGPEGR
jgi:hypothetical protein